MGPSAGLQEKHEVGNEDKQNNLTPAEGTQGHRGCFFLHIFLFSCSGGGGWKKKVSLFNEGAGS